MRHVSGLLVAALFAVATMVGCNCERGLSRNAPVLVVDRDTVDFGTVQINLEHTRKLVVRNDGSTSLTLSEPELSAPFVLKTVLPLTIPIGGQDELLIAYKPTVANAVDSGTLTFKTDDPANVTKTITVRGQGVQAVASIVPNPIEFGDVYAGANKQLKVKLTNSGTNTLTVASVLFGAGKTPSLSGDLSPLNVNLAAGASSETTLTYAPPDEETLSAVLRFEFDPLQGGEVLVPIQGRGIRARPVACWRWQGETTERCTDPDAGTPALNVSFGAVCDNRVTPPGTDGGCTAQSGERTGQVYLRNDGNTPVKFSASWYPSFPARGCDGGAPAPPDYLFSNTPDAGLHQFQTATVQVPGALGDPRPWETPPVSIRYRATSRCTDDASDSASVTFVRQGDTRPPTFITVVMSGRSALPSAKESDVTTVSSAFQLPTSIPIVGAVNRGDAPMTINSVELMEELLDAGVGSGPNGGVLQPCATAVAPASHCRRFQWSADGGDPNTRTPITVAPDDGGTAVPAIGTLVFGADAGTDCTFGVCTNRQYRIYAVVETSDPYRPQVISTITATATQ